MFQKWNATTSTWEHVADADNISLTDGFPLVDKCELYVDNKKVPETDLLEKYSTYKHIIRLLTVSEEGKKSLNWKHFYGDTHPNRKRFEDVVASGVTTHHGNPALKSRKSLITGGKKPVLPFSFDDFHLFKTEKILFADGKKILSWLLSMM